MAWALCIILLAGLSVLGVFHLLEKRRLGKEIAALTASNAELRDQLSALNTRISYLARFEGIADVDFEITKRRQDIAEAEQQARDAAAKMHSDTAESISQQNEEIKQLKAEARKLIQETEESQGALLGKASAEASRILSDANQKAEEIGGDAYRSLREVEHLKATEKAMKNIIKGYGDEYLIPAQSILDELAESYSHKQAGMDLKVARSKTSQMVNTGSAASCDYAEANRKTIAMEFVLDAFNGKVDTHLAKVKHDNFGKLKQQMVDAFHTVNNNGKAFRNARILPEYLESRLQELKWAVATTELQREEREEQRQIKQEMREEERARREYEKAIKDAEKEERLLEKLMSEARAKYEVASEQEREEYQKQIDELERKHREAEERNQRAISMAQQTKRGHVYVISNVGSFGDDVFKIGLTRRLEPLDRVKELGDASVPFQFDVHAMIYNDDAPKLETTLHRIFNDFQMNKVNQRKEFFRIGVQEIKQSLDTLGIEARWTMAAEAREYRETQAIEHASTERLVRQPDESTIEQLANSGTWEEANQLAAPEPDDPSTPEPETQDATRDTMIVPCPLCEGDLDAYTLVVGSNICPHCQGEFQAT
jgi:DNA repair exonuclease SbcCD ATPase subunit